MDFLDPILDWIESFYRTVTALIEPVWSRMAPGDALPRYVILLVAIVGAAAVAPGLWRITRHTITIVHEMGHVMTAGMTGRRVDGIRLHTDTSGLALTAGKPRGLGMILTSISGYTAPATWGALLIIAAAFGWSGLALTITFLLLIGAFSLVRNVWGVVTIVVSLIIAGGVWWYQAGEVSSLVTVALGGFLIAGGLRSTAELAVQHKETRCSSCDAGQAGSLSGLGAGFWIGWFQVHNLVCLTGVCVALVAMMVGL